MIQEDYMRHHSRIFGVAVLVMAAALIMLSTSCFGTNPANTTNSPTTPTVIKPQPRVENVVATTSGTKSSYYATLAIKVKNEGAEGTILVIGTVTQAGKSAQNDMEVFLKQGESHELKLTYPLVWQGGDFTPSVQAIVP
jgi:hypothetical protein